MLAMLEWVSSASALRVAGVLEDAEGRAAAVLWRCDEPGEEKGSKSWSCDPRKRGVEGNAAERLVLVDMSPVYSCIAA